jgi:hypothetical protein
VTIDVEGEAHVGVSHKLLDELGVNAEKQANCTASVLNSSG